MRHQRAGVHLSRTSAHRKALFSNLVAALFTNERIRTTDAKAKETRRLAERTITWARRVGDVLGKKPERRTTEESARVVHAVRMARRIVRDRGAVLKLFDEPSTISAASMTSSPLWLPATCTRITSPPNTRRRLDCRSGTFNTTWRMWRPVPPKMRLRVLILESRGTALDTERTASFGEASSSRSQLAGSSASRTCVHFPFQAARARSGIAAALL